ncbi:hypothetical protein BK022_04380 [Methylorubrum extorquens]|uniref:Hemolysin-type calcium-binding region n=1 Tax=Methylorubrum extorquens TaxID=408 RepID=A0A1S1P7K0_METEX|nr:hypothetical protein BK022_04380 [Methylorubrum extorquens]
MGDAGNNVLDGGAGGTDTINGLGGIDTVSYASSTVGVVIDLNGQRTWDRRSTDTLVSVENAIGSQYDDTLLGDAGTNVLDGGTGGTDTINGLGGIDTISYASSTVGVVIDLNAQRTWDSTALDTLVSIENAIGSRYDDTLLGDASNNVLDGGAGGTDTINGLEGIDTASYANSSVGAVIDLNAQRTWDGTALDTLVSIENAIGSRYDDTLLGDASNNVLDGGAGGTDTINGLGGIDTISHASSSGRVVIDLNAQRTWDGTALDTLVSIENATGSRYDDDVLGDAGNNVLDGGSGGSDFINGLGGIDTVSYASSVVGTVVDLNAQKTWDGSATDTLSSIENAIGSQYNDTLIGSSANNFLVGGGGSDTFLFKAIFGQDIISDFRTGVGAESDIIAFDRGVFVNDNPLQSATQFGSDVVLSATYGSSIKLLDIKLAELSIDSFHII